MNGKKSVVLAAAVALACGGSVESAGPGADPSQQGAEVTISPLVASVVTGGMVAFTASVTGLASTAVAWSVEEGAAGGSVTSSGLYSAPSTAGSYHVVVASAADPTKMATATVNVTGGATGGTTLAGVGWTGSTSLTDFPKTGPVTSGGTIVDIDDGLNGRTPAQRLSDALALLSSNNRVIIRNNSNAPVMLTTRITRSTAWSTKKEVFAYGTQRITIDATNLPAYSPLKFTGASNEHWKGFEFINQNYPSGGWNSVVHIENSHNLKIEDIWIHHNASSASGVGLLGSDHVVVQDCIIWHNGDGTSQNTNVGDGLAASGDYSGGGPMSSYVQFVRDVVINAADDSVDLYYSHHCSVIDCAFVESGRYWNGNNAGDGNGIKGGGYLGGSPYTAGSAQAFIGNAVVGMKAVGINWKSGTVPQTAHHNTVYSNKHAGFVYEALPHDFHDNMSAANTGAVWPTNVNPYGGNYQDLIASAVNSYSNTYQITSPATMAAPFVDAANGDLSLPSGSPYIGSGTGGSNAGASVIALQLLKENWTRR